MLREYKNKDGSISSSYVYRKPPDLNAIKYAIDRVIGPPQKQQTELDQELSKVKTMSEIIKSHDKRKKDD